MGCREPGCNVLHRLGRLAQNMASLLLVSRGLPATGAAFFRADPDFCREEAQWAVSV